MDAEEFFKQHSKPSEGEKTVPAHTEQRTSPQKESPARISTDDTPVAGSVDSISLIENILRHQNERRQEGYRGSFGLCILLGFLFLALGANYLFFNPSEGDYTVIGEIVNLHRLTIGATSTISGIIFLAAALRPR